MMLKSLRNAFISGLLLLAPVGVTVFVLLFLIDKIGTPTRDIFFFFVPEEMFARREMRLLLDILSAFYVLILITLLGYLSRLFIGKLAVQAFDRLITNVPVVNIIYNTVKQIIDTFSQQKQAVFQKVVMTEFPRKGVFVIGFLTGRGKGEIQHRTAREVWNIFIPTTPNPTSGFLVMIPREEVTELDMTVSEGMKLIISGGAVAPQYLPREGHPAGAVVVQNPSEEAAPQQPARS